MLIEKEIPNIPLSVVRKPRVKIIKMKQGGTKPVSSKKDNSSLFPPRDQFNTGYIKGRDNDPL